MASVPQRASAPAPAPTLGRDHEVSGPGVGARLEHGFQENESDSERGAGEAEPHLAASRARHHTESSAGGYIIRLPA